jgi:hypothetical protein
MEVLRMMMRKTWVLCALLSVLAYGCWAQSEEAQSPSSQDTPAPAALSKEAEGALRTVAHVQAGVTRMEPWKAGSTYGMRYVVNPQRGIDEAATQRLREEWGRRTAARLVTLRDWADLDQSGSVTAGEAHALAWLYQFGRLVPFVMEQESTDEGPAVARALQRPVDVLRKEYQTYIEHQARLGEDFGPQIRLKWPGDPAG